MKPLFRGLAVVGLSLALAGSLAMLPSDVSTARAAVAEPARVRASAALIDEVVARLLPLDVVLPVEPGATPDAGSDGTPQPAQVTELRYCGATDKGTGRFRAVLRWGAFGAAQPALAGSDGCRHTLNDIAKQVGAAETPRSGSGVSVVDLEASWRPWQLSLSVTRALMPPTPTPPRPGPPRPLAGLETRRELLVLPTAGLRLPTVGGDTIAVHAAPSFAADGIEVAVLVADGIGSSPPAARPSSSGGALAVPVEANLVAELPAGFANQVLRTLSGGQPLAISVDRDIVDVQNLSISFGASGGAALVGLATPRSLRETVRITVGVSGPDLKVVSVRADAQLENCATVGGLSAITCNARNAARSTAAAAVGAAASQKYQGRLVRELAGSQTLVIDFGGRRVGLTGELTRTAGGPRGLTVGARLAPGGMGH
jgi:hypothetical protein